MIKENQRVLNLLNVLSDGCLIVLSFALSYLIRFVLFQGDPNHVGLGYYIKLSLICAPFFLFLYAMFGLYESFRTRRFLNELERLIQVNLLGTGVLIMTLFVLRRVNVSRWTLVLFCAISTVLVASKRFALRRLLHHFRTMGYNQKQVLIVGSGALAQEYVTNISRNVDFGLIPVGYVAQNEAPFGSLPRVGSFGELERVLEQSPIDEVVAALSLEESHQIGDIIRACEKQGVKLSLIPFYAEYMPPHPYIDEVAGMPLINLRRIPLDNIANAAAKRMMDVCGALLLIVLTSPLMLFAAIGTKLSSPGPIIFRQERVGRYKKIFTMYKFRSMRVNSQQDTGWSQNRDPRKTRFGALIRKCSIDELPQFFNVLKGDMSLVGPRPEVPHFVDQFRETIPLYMVKHQVRPGITGWAQVNGLRGDTSIEDRIQHDLFYIENWSLLLDIKILFLTLFKGMMNQERLS